MNLVKQTSNLITLFFTELSPEVRAEIVKTMEPVLRQIFETTWTGATYDEVMSYAK